MSRLARLLLLLGCAAATCFAAARPEVSIDAPIDRLVAPGEFVTLVFRLEASERLEVVATARSERGWRVLRQPGTLELDPDGRKPVAVTVEIPADAAALSTERITLELRGADLRIGASVLLSVTERLEIDLEAPREVALDGGEIPVAVTNRSNVADSVTPTLSPIDPPGEDVTLDPIPLAPLERVTLRFPVTTAGRYRLLLESERGLERRAEVRVLAFGVPEPEPLRLAAELRGRLDTEGRAQGRLRLDGPLSDWLELYSVLDARHPLSSFATLEAEDWHIRLGRETRPFGLDLPDDFGLSGSYRLLPWTVAAGVGWIEADRFSGYVAGSYASEMERFSAGVGINGGSLALAASGEGRLDEGEAGWHGLEWQVDASFLRGRLDASVELGQQLTEREGSASGRLEARGLFTENAVLDLGVTLAAAEMQLNGALTVPLAPDAAWSAGLGVRAPMPSRLPGRLDLGLQVATGESFAALYYQATLDNGWQTRDRFGVVHDASGFGLLLESSWLARTSERNAFGLSGEGTWYPETGELRAALGGRIQARLEGFTLFLDGSWKPTEAALGLSAGTQWRDGPWRVDVEGNLDYDGANALQPWELAVSIAGRYAFGFDVPPKLTEFAGGRRLGTLEGIVLAGDHPVTGVQVRVGTYRLLSDPDGRFEAILEPGEYEVTLDVTTLPFTVRPLGPVRQIVQIEARASTRVDFRVSETAAMTGRVLLDSDGDGSPDEPNQGVAAQLRVRDAEGLWRLVDTTPDGTFRIAGLFPGVAAVTLLAPPLHGIVGRETQRLELLAGEITEVAFLLRPTPLEVQSFGRGDLRIRRITPEVDSAPPGSAPLVRVDLRGQADRVAIETAEALVQLSPAGDGGAWEGRLPVPRNAPDGPLSFSVVAGREETEVSRKGQLLVGRSAPAFALEPLEAVPPGGVLTLRATPYFQAASVTALSPFGSEVVFTRDPTRPGAWQGELLVPPTAAPGIQELRVRFVDQEGNRSGQALPFRVLAPTQQ